MEYLETLSNKLSTKEIDLIKYGGFEHSEFEGDIREALTNNTFNDNYIFSSLPGFGKTTSLNNIADELGIKLVKFDGSMGLFAFAADLASVLLQAPDDDSKIYCSVDDCDSLFDKKNLNTTKGIFDKKRRVLSYGMSMPPAYHMLDDIQKEAIDAFKTPGRSGFRIPTDRFVFIVLTNKEFPTTGDLKRVSESKKEYKTDLNAIRRRTEYNELTFEGDVDWGYCSHVVMSRPVCEYIHPDVTLDQKIEMLRFTSRHWKDITDQNLSIFDKMTKVLVRSPQNYYDIWMSKYIDK
jgi:hypothetical protein